jgi:hypothetical protein
MIAVMMSLMMGPIAGPPALDYQGFFYGQADRRECPCPGYYYDPQSYVPYGLRRYLEPVRVKVFDGGSVCPNLTRYKTYLYSEDPLPGQYWVQDPGRMRPILTDGWGSWRPYDRNR